MFHTKQWRFTICALLTLCSTTHAIYIADRYQGSGEFYTAPHLLPLAKSSFRADDDMKGDASEKWFGNGNAHGGPYQGGQFNYLKGFPIRLLAHKLPPSMWATNILKDKSSDITSLDEAEPGFDFSEEEMKKLKIWPGGVIPYYIDEFSFDKVFRDRIRTFLEVTNSVTGLNFIELHRPPDDDDTRWVMFVNRQGLLSCADHPFKNFTSEGVQKILLGYDCLATGGELAEVVLALVGVPPQHNAPDRMKHIEIVKENIIPGKAYLFEKLKDNEWLFHDVNYDFSSASHYPLHKYTANGMATIKPLGDIDITIGEGNGFSFTDIWKIRMLYNYISKKRLKSINLPECKKLFNVGANISKFEPNTDDDVEPRKKPSKYLGLSENVVGSPDSTPDIINPKEVKSKNLYLNKETNEEIEESKKKENKKNKNPNRNKTHEDGYKALHDLSDYNTNEEYAGMNQKESKFTNIGK